MLRIGHDHLLTGRIGAGAARFRRVGLRSALVVLVVVAGGCGLIRDDPPADETMEPRSIEAVLEAFTPGWMELDAVVGTGIGLCEDEPCIRVFLSRESEEARDAIPDRVEGHRVELEVTGPFRPRGIPDSTSI